MKALRNLCAAVTLILVLSLTTMAGEITTMAVPTPTPPPASAMATEPTDIDTGAIENPVESESLITEVTSAILQLLSVF